MCGRLRVGKGMKTRSCSIRLARPRILVRELADVPFGRIGVDIARFDPLVPGPARVSCCPKYAAYALRCHQPQNRRGARERAQLLDMHPRVAVPLVSVGVALGSFRLVL
jgi:hypothetical protein